MPDEANTTGSNEPLGIDVVSFIEWRAETKNELKWIRNEIGSVAKTQKEVAKNVAANKTSIDVLTAKVTLYAAAAGTICGLVVTISILVLQAILK